MSATLIEYEYRLAPMSNAPEKVIGRLSRSDDIAIAAPVLGKSEVLKDEVIVEVAKTKGLRHLRQSPIARASARAIRCTVDRGNADNARKVTNLGARISGSCFVKFDQTGARRCRIYRAHRGPKGHAARIAAVFKPAPAHLISFQQCQETRTAQYGLGGPLSGRRISSYR
jgi:hypothetical protein